MKPRLFRPCVLSLRNDDLDKTSVSVPSGWEDTFGTYPLCLQFVADHWHMHRATWLTPGVWLA